MFADHITRAQLIARLSERCQVPTDIAEPVVKTILNALSEALIQKDRIEVRDFGSFEVRTRSARIARNPRTGALVQANEKHRVHFKPGRALRNRVNH